MSMPLSWNKVRETVSKKDNTPALVLDITEHVVDNMLLYHIQIVKQKYTGTQLYRGSNSFTASNGFTFASASCPAGSSHNSNNSGDNYHMYIRGSNRQSNDEVVLTRSLGYVEKLKEAVKEYNYLMN